MKILALSTWFPYPPDNGSKLRTYHLLRSLAERHQVTLLSFAFATARPDAPSELEKWCQDIRVIPVDPFQVNRVNILQTFLSPRPMASRAIPAMSRLVSDALRTRTFDVVIASTEMMADYALMVPSSATKILEEHNTMIRWARERYQQAQGNVQRVRCWLSWRKGLRYEVRLYPRFDLVTMVSGADRQATVENVGSRLQVEVVPNGVDCAHNQPGLAQPQLKRLVFNGSLTYSANYDAMQWFLAQVWPRIRAQAPDATLVITGATAGADLARLALDEQVHLTGFVEDVRLPVAEAAVAIAPIRQGGGTRLKILEAMALGTPIVATSKAAEGLDVAQGENLLMADSPEAFARCVVELLNAPDLRGRLSANARRLVETRYDWQTIGARFTYLVEATVKERGSREK